MDDFLGSLGGALGMLAIGLPASLFVFLVFGGTTMVKNWLDARQANRLTALKQAMVEHGMSAVEIVRVIEAGNAEEESSPRPLKRASELKG